jgi:hypothetical protein
MGFPVSTIAAGKQSGPGDVWETKWNAKKRKILMDATVPMSHVVEKEYAAIV